MTGEDLCGYVDLRFYSNSGVRRNYTLPEARGLRITDELAADGAASFSAPLLAQALAVSPDLLEDGFCKAAMVLAPGEAPTEVFGWEQVPTSGRLVGEPADKAATVTASGLRNVLSHAVVFPEVGGWDKNTEDARLFGWMSAQSTHWYSAADWTAPVSYRNVLTTGSWPFAGTAEITMDLTPAADDVNLFRTTFTLAAASRVRIYYLADESVSLYLNSELLVEASGYEALHTQSVNLVLSAGTHTLAALVTNNDRTELMLACAVATVSSTGAMTLVRKTDLTHWKGHKVIGGVYPGWNAAGILLKLVEEANALSVFGTSLLTADFTATTDSAGVAWPAADRVDAKAFPVAQTTVLDVVRDLEDAVPSFDVHVKPDFTLQAFGSQGQDRSATVWFQPGVNLLTLDYNGSPVVATKALVRSVGGWSLGINATGVTNYGVRYTGITSGTSVSRGQGSRLGDNMLRRLARPTYTYTATLRAVAGCVPWRDFFKGDRVMIPVRGGSTAAMRVLSISASTPEDTAGPVLFTVELEAP